MEDKTPLDYLREPYAFVTVREGEGGYYAEILEFPGCFASGDTREEASQNLEQVAVEWIKAEIEAGREIPRPSDPESFGGKFALRMPRGLHQLASRMAEREDTSLNSYIITAIAARVGADDLFHRMSQRFGTYQVNVFTFLTGGGVNALSEAAAYFMIPHKIPGYELSTVGSPSMLTS